MRTIDKCTRSMKEEWIYIYSSIIISINNEPWFVGKDVASALDYGEGKSLANAVANHVDLEDRRVTEMMTPRRKA